MKELKIEALVKFNSSLAVVFNRTPEYKYQRDGDLLWAKDGPFYSCFGYESPSGSFQAFAGRKFDLQLLSGGVVHCEGQWWDKGLNKLSEKLNLQLTHLTMQTRENLIKCYVFFGTSCNKAEIEQMISEYTGPTYEYWDYEKVIKFDGMRKDFWSKQFYQEKTKKHLITKVKEQAKIIKKLQLTAA